MTSYSDTIPAPFQRGTQTSTLVCYNVRPHQSRHGEEVVNDYEFESVYVEGLTPDKGGIVNAIVRERYTVADELAILRQRDSKPAEFEAYNDFVEAAKIVADELLK